MNKKSENYQQKIIFYGRKEVIVRGKKNLAPEIMR